MNRRLSIKISNSPRLLSSIVLLVSIMTVGGIGYGYLQQQQRLILAEKYNELRAISDLKSSQIVQWRKERLAEATSIQSNAMVSHRIEDYLHGADRTRALSEFRTWMASLQSNGVYNNVHLYKPDGAMIVSVPGNSFKSTDHYRRQVVDAAESGRIIFSDFHDEDGNGSIDIDLVIPLKYSNHGEDHTCAVLILDFNPHAYLYPLIQKWPTPSETAETLLVERRGDDVLFLNDLRFRSKAALSHRVPLSNTDMPAVRAALGEEGIFSGTDYRGMPVLSSLRSIHGSPWAMVAKIDSSEITAPIVRRAWFVAAICATIVIAINLGISLWWTRKKEAYLQTLYDAELGFNNSLRNTERALQISRNELETRVIERTRELSESNTKLVQEMNERLRLEKQLIESKKLESIGQIAGGVAHEVRNPLNAILTITEALFREKEIESNPEYLPYIKHIRTQVTRLASLMNDLLDLGKTIPASSMQPVSLYELCCDTITLWKSSGSSANKQIVLECPDPKEKQIVMADSVRLQQVIFNLMENAAQHTPPNGTVRFIILGTDKPNSEPGMAVIRITDQGKGIAPEKIARIFDPFYSDRKGGTGLGLALVKHFVENMGGFVRIWNNEPPPGCTAEIIIPRICEDQK